MAENAHCHPTEAGLHETRTDAPGDWLVPDWPAPARVHALCTTRAGGVSECGYTSMNLGDHVSDQPQAVARNRERLAAALQRITPGARPVFLNQVHGIHCAKLSSASPDGAACDAAVATKSGLACTIMVADCLPVLLTDTSGCAVAAAHAGWRGLAGGVLESVVTGFRALAQEGQALSAINSIATTKNAGVGDLLAWLGPCIGPGAFEVGEEVRNAFCALDAGARLHFIQSSDRKYLADLAGLARRRLAALGISQIYGNDSSDGWCTVRQESRFFSHRRDGTRVGSGDGLSVAGTGRMAACIWLG